MLGTDYFRIRERFDWALFIAAALVAVIGIVNLYSATSVYSGARAEQYVNQVYWLVAGGILAVFTASIDYRHFERLGYVVYIGGVVCLILVFVLGRDIRGSARCRRGRGLVSVVASVRHLKPCTRTSAGRKVLNGVTNGLSRVNEAAVPKPTAPARCEEPRQVPRS